MASPTGKTSHPIQSWLHATHSASGSRWKCQFLNTYCVEMPSSPVMTAMPRKIHPIGFRGLREASSAPNTA